MPGDLACVLVKQSGQVALIVRVGRAVHELLASKEGLQNATPTRLREGSSAVDAWSALLVDSLGRASHQGLLFN